MLGIIFLIILAVIILGALTEAYTDSNISSWFKTRRRVKNLPRMVFVDENGKILKVQKQKSKSRINWF
jgi:hypothetical protein